MRSVTSDGLPDIDIAPEFRPPATERAVVTGCPSIPLREGLAAQLEWALSESFHGTVAV